MSVAGLAVLLGAAFPAPAGSAADIGIHELRPDYIQSDPRWRELVKGHSPRLARSIFPWYLALPGRDEAAGLDAWLTAVQSTHTQPLIALNIGGSKRPPRPERFATAFQALMRYTKPPWNVRDIEVFNEPNRRPTRRNKAVQRRERRRVYVPPGRAARYFRYAVRIARRECPECRLVAGDFAGGAGQGRYIQTYLRAVRRARPRRWILGIHTQRDIQRFQLCISAAHRSALKEENPDRNIREFCAPGGRGAGALQIRAFLDEFRRFRRRFPRSMRRAQIWITEIPAYRTLHFEGNDRASFSPAQHCAATAFIQRLARLDRRIRRIYYLRFWEQPIDLRKTPAKNDKGLVPIRFDLTRGRSISDNLQAFFNVKYENQKCHKRAYGTRFEVPPPDSAWIAGHRPGDGTRIMADPTGDGKADAVVFQPDGSWWVARSNGRAFVDARQWAAGHGVNSAKQMLNDVDGDGDADAVAFNQQAGEWSVALSNERDAFAVQPQAWRSNFGSGAGRVPMLGDVNDDLKADAIIYEREQAAWFVALSNGASFGEPTPWIAGHRADSDEQMMDDVNGDDAADAVAYEASSGEWYVATSNRSNGFNPPSLWRSNFGGGSEKQVLDDVTGDNLADAIAYDDDSGTWAVAAAAPGSFFFPTQAFLDPTPWATNFGQRVSNHFVADATGDFRGDAVIYRSDSASWQVAPARPPPGYR